MVAPSPAPSIVWAWCTPSDRRLRAFGAIFVDTALGIFRYRVVAIIPKMNAVRSNAIPPARHNQQSAELWVLCWAIHLARRFGWHCLFLLTDSQVAGNFFLSNRPVQKVPGPVGQSAEFLAKYRFRQCQEVVCPKVKYQTARMMHTQDM